MLCLWWLAGRGKSSRAAGAAGAAGAEQVEFSSSALFL